MDMDSHILGSGPKVVLERLACIGVPEECLSKPGLVEFVKADRSRIPELVSALLPTDREVLGELKESRERSQKASVSSRVKKMFRESMDWLQWLMFEDDPVVSLRFLANSSLGQRGICGSVWGQNDIAYMCRTCENDPTCAICVPCFQNGNHSNHDYAIIYTGGGCCDCGDETAWKREGFCSKHKGSEQIQPLPENLAKSVGPVLDAIFAIWKNKLLSAKSISQKDNTSSRDNLVEIRRRPNELTFIAVEMLSEFCNSSESLLSFVSRSIISSDGLLDSLVKAERYLHQEVLNKLHQLLLKLIGDPKFKSEFAKSFVSYYPVVVSEAVKQGGDNTFKKYPLLSTFSVQIFTVPTLTPVLVKEMNLLSILFGCLSEIFLSCAGDDGVLQGTKWEQLCETSDRVIRDLTFVMSHAVVSKYATHEQQDLSRYWLILLTFVQGMNPLKRETGIHIEEENDYMHPLFLFNHFITVMHSLLVDDVYSSGTKREIEGGKATKIESDTDDGDGERHAKVGRLSHEDSVCSAMGSSGSYDDISMATGVQSLDSSPDLLPSSAIWLIRECLKVLETCLEDDEGISKFLCNISAAISGRKFSKPKREISKVEARKMMFSCLSSSTGYPTTGSSPLFGDIQSNLNLENGSRPNGQVQTGITADPGTVSCNSAFSLKNAPEGLCILGLCDWPEIHYDVGTQGLSVHLPLHRLLSLLIERALRICYGESALPHILNASYQSPHVDFFRYIIGNFHPYGFSAFIMEHALRIRVFCAQVTAGMWRRNGDAVLVSREWYRSVHWSEQAVAVDLDLFLLQCCGALAPADSYVKQILDRFELSGYLLLGPNRSNEYEPVLVQEMLTLLIQILQERQFCGFTTAESLKREIVYKLATGDATHSQLVKSLPSGLGKSDKLQEVLDSVSVYCNPSGFNQGKYSLRSSCWKELDLYHPRWHSRDLQAAEERYSRYCGVSAVTTQLPRWRKIYPPLKELAKIGTCRATLQILSTVLYYALYSSTSVESRAPDGVLITALHLLSLSLDICIQQREYSQSCGTEDSIPILDLAGQEIIGIDQRTGKQSLLSLLVSLMRTRKDDDQITEAGSCNISSWVGKLLEKFCEISSPSKIMLQNLAPEVVGHLSNPNKVILGSSSVDNRKAKARDRQAAILAKMKAEQSKFLSALSSSMEDDSPESESSNSVVGHDSEPLIHEVCSLCRDLNSKDPVSFLIFLQKSKLLSSVDRGPPFWDRVEQSEKLSTDGVRDDFGIYVSSDNLGVSSPHLLQLPEDAISEYLRARLMKNNQVQCRSSDAKGNNECGLEMLEKTMYGTIRKRLDGLKGKISAYAERQQPKAQSSASVSYNEQFDLNGRHVDILTKKTSRCAPSNEPRSEYAPRAGFDGFSPSNCDGINLSSCGHAVHQGCLERYLTSLRERSVRRNVFEGAHIVDVDRGEFLCPVCRRLANSILPATLGDSCTVSKLQQNSNAYSDRMDGHSYTLMLPEALCLLESTAEMIEDSDTVKVVLFQGDAQRRQDLEYVSSKLWNLYFSEKQEKSLEIPWVVQSIVMWDTLKYSLISMEIAARCGKASLLPVYCIDSLFDEFKTSSGLILSLLLRVVQSTRTKNAIHVRQRFMGMQLFAESVCSGISGNYSSSIYAREGKAPRLLKTVNPASFCADVLFWNRASDPVLARDPFSSLMWILFCLPSPCISCEESLLSLVHIFYTVSLIQIVIAYCACNLCDWGASFEESLLSDIFNAWKESGCGWQYFKLNHMDFSCGVKDTLRKCSFPFLRRCALLWRLLKSAPGQFLVRDHMDVSSDSTCDEMDFTYSAQSEVSEVQELEKMFKIPPIDVVLKDEHLRSLAQKWLQHLRREHEVSRIKGPVCVSPAVPFRLMRLPHLYQDLLQRYIKQSCSDCTRVIDEPALCLLCGRLCSPSWRPCCRESGCQAHAMSCGAGTGVFLLIRRTIILLQRSARQSPWPSPYLDAFGEEDHDMNRGKPLYLNEERYAALNYMVASHGLDQSTKVLAHTTIGAIAT